MFLRDLKVKSNNQLKRTELKALRDVITKSYPVLTEDNLDAIFPKKESINVIKVECCITKTSTRTVLVYYAVRTKPIWFESNGELLPTVFLLWEFPTLLSLSFTTYENVISHITNGADLMMPGVVVPPQGYGAFELNRPAYVNLNSNKVALAVGRTAQNSFELMRNRTGKCVQILHFYGDKLCTLFQSWSIPTVPNFGPPLFLIDDNNKMKCMFATRNENQDKENNAATSTSTSTVSVPIPIPVQVIDTATEEEIKLNQFTIKTETETEIMDQLLIRCLLTVLKYSKSLKLPVLTSNLYKQMTDVCPAGKTLDIKKSQYKKVGIFIRDMSKLGLLTRKEEKKGVEIVTEYNQGHEMFTDFYLEKCERPVTVTDSLKGTGSSNEKKILEGYIITPSTVKFFHNFGLQKGQTVQAADIRKHVTDFVKKNNIQDQKDKSLVHPKGELADLLKTTASLTWLELMEKVFKMMRPCYTVCSNDGGMKYNFQQDSVVKGKLEPINMVIQRRSGNRKVTLVDNLELYGINIVGFSRECQRALSVSATLSLPPGKKSQQLLLQGNHIEYLHHLLKEEYKIPERYMRGLEFADKKK